MGQAVAGRRLVSSVDVAMENFFRGVHVSPLTVLGIIKRRHPSETPVLGERLRALSATSNAVAFEPS